MKRRDVLLGMAATGAGLRAGAQEVPKRARIGFIVAGNTFPRRWFDQAMQRLGWIEGHNLVVEQRVTAKIRSGARPPPPS
jgi:hypothetical protein